MSELAAFQHEYIKVTVSNRHDQFVLGVMGMIYVRADSLSEYVSKLHHAYKTYDASLGVIQLRDVEVDLNVLVVGDKRCVSTIMTFGCSDIVWEEAPDIVRRSYNEVNE